MRKLLAFLLVLVVALPVFAQEEGESEMPAPPPPLENDYFNWMLGEWKGSTKGTMGESEDWVNCKMGFGGQFMMVEYSSKMPMGEYTGGGAFTMNPDGDVVAYWIDSMRDMGKGTGSIEGDVMTMNWESKMGKGTRITKKISDDKYEVTSKWEMPDGTVMESKSEMTRVKTMTDK